MQYYFVRFFFLFYYYYSHMIFREPYIFSFTWFIISGFKLRSLTYWELIFVDNKGYSSKFILLHVEEVFSFQFSQQHLLKMLTFSLCVFLTFLSNMRWLFDLKLIFSSIDWHVCLFFFVPVPCWFCKYSSVI